MMEVCALASGSNGNCYYIGNETEAVLIDVGITRRQVIDRMGKVGLNINKVKAIFISHEHSDHCQGVRVLSERHDIPVYMTSITFNNSREQNRPEKYLILNKDVVVAIGEIRVTAFAKFHDAVDPCSFVVEIEGKKVGVMTDIGYACENVIESFKQCDAVYLEANYDETMLQQGPYPPHLKFRVASNKGHLSNKQAVELAEGYANVNLKTIFLSHISYENNHPTIALKEFERLSKNCNIHLTNRFAPTNVFQI